MSARVHLDQVFGCEGDAARERLPTTREIDLAPHHALLDPLFQHQERGQVGDPSGGTAVEAERSARAEPGIVQGRNDEVAHGLARPTLREEHFRHETARGTRVGEVLERGSNREIERRARNRPTQASHARREQTSGLGDVEGAAFALGVDLVRLQQKVAKCEGPIRAGCPGLGHELGATAPGFERALASRLLGHACLVALYERAGLLFSLGNQRAVSLRAMKSREREARAGKVALAELMALSTARRHDLERELAELSMGRVWVLLFLEGGSDAVVAMATLPQSAFSGTLSVAALLVSPDTRARGVEIADSLKLSEQIDLMHELMHAHDNARPWAASYKLDLARTLSTSPFAKKNRVFAALAWRLWDGGRQPEEAVAALVREGAAEQLDKRSQDAIADYYMQSYFRLMRQRQGGDEMIDRADKALVASGFRGLASLSQADLDGRIPRPEGL